MRARYQQLIDGGVWDHETRTTILPKEDGWDEYRAWLSAGNVPLPPVKKIPSLIEAKATIKKSIEHRATALRNKASLGISAREMAAWSFKFPEAKKIASYGESTTNAVIKKNNPRIWSEAEIRGIPVRSLAEKIVEKAEAFWDVEARIAGTSGKHSDAVDRFDDVRDVLFYKWDDNWPEV